jgi:tRNA threonylcarbamoyladenosine biosynthesis protein TsaB
MITLAIDTAGREGSVALAEAGHGRFAVLGLAPLAGGTYSAQLIPTIAGLLEAAGVAKGAVDLLAVNSGPGSFTGLRVGLSTVKGLAESLHKPIVAISGLEALAIAAWLAALSNRPASHAHPAERSANRRVIAAMDAQRKEVYVGEYDLSPATATTAIAGGPVRGEPGSNRQNNTDDDDIPRAVCLGERLISLADFIAETASATTTAQTGERGESFPGRAICTADASIEHALRADGADVEMAERPRADLFARIGVARFRQGATISPEALDANYIRRSDAEIFSTPTPRAVRE